MSQSNLNTEKLVGVEVSKSAFRAVCFDQSGTLIDSLRYKIDKSNPTFPQLVNFLNEAKKRFAAANESASPFPD
jgi:hypothetical protein